MHRLLLGAALLLAGCSSVSNGDGGTTKLPPQVFLTVDETNVIGNSVTGKVNTAGCKNVTQVQMLQAGSFLADLNYQGSPTSFSLPSALFAPLYNQLGIAAELTLSAKIVCDDGRTNTSQPVGVSFFPVASHLSTGNQLVPDSFTAGGGLSGTPVSLVGCVGTKQGVALASFDTSGSGGAVLQNDSLDFACTSNLVISARSKANGIRWMMEPGVGAVAVDDTLTIKKSVTGKFTRLGVSSTGTAILWEDALTKTILHKVEPVADVSNDWVNDTLIGVMNSDPVVDVGNRLIWATMWQFDLGSQKADIVAYELNLDSGLAVNLLSGGAPPVLISQQYPMTLVDSPIMPQGTFSADGKLFYVPLLSQDNTTVVHTTVIACATAGTCTKSTRRWTSQTFDGVVNTVLPFSAGNYIAAIGPYQVWFLKEQDGTIANLGEAAIRPSGNLQVLGVQPGVNAEMYILNGPVAAGTATWPIEAVAVDKPESGELWRFGWGSGASANTGITLGVDESGQSWFRVGPDLVKPLPLAEYRQARGATPSP
jgi:hypothetical protein